MKTLAMCAAVITAVMTTFPAADFPMFELPEEPTYTEDDLYCMAAVIYNEAGGNACCDECRYRVGDVVLNRVADERFEGDTIREILEAPGQYYGMGNGVKFAARAKNPGEEKAVERAWETARKILSNERHSELYKKGYVWQATFIQGRDNVYCCGHYFGR